MDHRQERAIRRIMEKATFAICAVLNTSPELLPPVSSGDLPSVPLGDLRITETVTDALKKEGVTEADIEAAQR